MLDPYNASSQLGDPHDEEGDCQSFEIVENLVSLVVFDILWVEYAVELLFLHPVEAGSADNAYGIEHHHSHMVAVPTKLRAIGPLNVFIFH